MRSALALLSHSRQNKDNKIVSFEVNYFGAQSYTRVVDERSAQSGESF